MALNKLRAFHLLKGEAAEQKALKYLQQQGLKLITQNYRCKYGELDLIMQDQTALVIVEVRYRKNQQFGGALESINRSKQARIIAAAQHYLINHKTNAPIRFDVIAMTENNPLNWIKNAFQLN